MIFCRTNIDGAYLVELEPRVDERGLFARTFCKREFEQLGLSLEFVQTNTAFTHRRGTLRGLHYQAAPFGETKLVRCTCGSAFVAAVDLRPTSASYAQHIAFELSADNRRMLLVPQGCAQGYQTLADDTELSYQMTEYYRPDAARGVRYDDPRFGIAWPLPVTLLSEADQKWGTLA